MAEREPNKIYPRTIFNGPGDEIVISGMSGRYPNSYNLHEFEHNLYNKIDMVDDDERRWRHENAEIPKRSGKIYNLEKFDATFFGIHSKQAHAMDPQSRILIEKSYEAILDAGINPKSMQGTRTGVFIGVGLSESENKWFYEKVAIGGYGITGCCRAMLANRISYVLGLQGPSIAVDSACSSALYAFDAAFTAMRNGECDAALVGASNLLLHPYVTLQFAQLGVLSLDGTCRSFDANASGYVRSEAISVILLQKSRDSKRIYGTVVHSKTNCDGYKEEGIASPSCLMQAKLFNEFYTEINIKPETVSYIEAHGTGTIVGDIAECKALDEVFCKNRTTQLPIGSVKTNMGHSEAASGLCSIAKCILALENQLIPPNLNFTRNHPEINSLNENRLQVVHKTQKLDGSLIAINSTGFGGANAHCLLRGNPKSKINKGAPADSIPRLVTWSGRTEFACNVVHDVLASQPLDVEMIALLHSTQSESVKGNMFKSFGLFKHLENSKAQCVTKEVQHFNGLKRPIAYVFSGIGTQWNGMGTELLEVPIIRETIQKCHDLLKPKGLDLLNILTSPEETIFDNALHSFVGIASIQAALCDCLAVLNIQPDYIIGHSVGELGCAYADDCLTMEQMLLCAYARGMAISDTTNIKGAMAAIGVSYNSIKTLVPSSIDIACHNSTDSCTVSGPQNDIKEFVAKLTADGIFAREIPSSNMAYHSRYIRNVAPYLQKYLVEIIGTPKKRSTRWLSTSVSKDEWDLPESQYCSAQYQTNNLLSSVLFEETSLLLPSNAILIEIAPHGLLRSILRQSLPEAIYIPLTQRGNKQNLEFFLTALGKIYLNGIDIAIENLYPKVEFPVSRGTPRISHLIKWNHLDDWYVMKYVAQKAKSGEKRFLISLKNQNYDYISAHIVDEQCLFPEAGYLYLVWETFAGKNGKQMSDVNVQFRDIKFLRTTPIETSVEFLVMIQLGTGRFEITEDDVAVVTGYIKELSSNMKISKLPPLIKSDYPYLQTKDFYKELRLRGYQYNGQFRNVIEARSDGLHGKVRWSNNWVSFIHCLFQISFVGKDSRAFLVPTAIEKITIDTVQHQEFVNKFDSGNIKSHFLEVFANRNLNVCQSGGIEIKGLKTNQIMRRPIKQLPVMESYKFIPYLPTPKMTDTDSARICIEHVVENHPTPIVKCIELLNENITPFMTKLREAIDELPMIMGDLTILTSDKIECGDTINIVSGELSSQTNCMVIIKSGCLAEPEFFESSKASLVNDGYIISRESINLEYNQVNVPKHFNLILVIPTNRETLVLLQKKSVKMFKPLNSIKVSLEDKDFEWLEQLKAAGKNEAVLLYAQNEPFSGILGLVNCIRKEPNFSNVRCVLIDDPNAPPFDLANPFYKNQLELNFASNIYRQGQWGTYRHLALNKVTQNGPTRDHIYATLTQNGDLTTLRWFDRVTEVNDKQVNIQYAAVNIPDVMQVTGKLAVEVLSKSRLEQEYVLGFEYSGIDRNGIKVMGLAINGAISSHTISDPGLTWSCPSNWILEQAATVPFAYCTVYSALFLHGNVKKGNSILIHAGTRDVGLAAIRVTLAYGLKIFTTVSSKEERQFLLETFTDLKDNHIGNFEDLSFENMIQIETNGAGVDYILNSLPNEIFEASLRCLGTGGKFYEIGNMKNDVMIGVDQMMKDILFHTIQLNNLLEAPLETKLKLKMMLQKDIDAGIIKPIPATVYPASEIEAAFRSVESSKYIGKILLNICEDPYTGLSLPITLHRRLRCDGTSSYVVIGGLGGFGLELVDWLIMRGARKVVLSSRRGISNPYQAYRVKTWESYGVIIKITTSEVSSHSGCEKILNEAIQLGPVTAIFNLAVVICDSILENQTAEKFAQSLTPKAYATIYLDQLSRRLCPTLGHFVVFSSVTCGRGKAGQSNYGMANSIMERVIEQRNQHKLPGKSIQWGAIDDVGILNELQEDKHDFEIEGTSQQKISSCLNQLDNLLLSNSPLVTNMVLAEKRVRSYGDDILSIIASIMEIRNIKTIAMNATLAELGMESLMAVQIKQSLEHDFNIKLSIQHLRTITFAKLLELNKQSEQAIIVDGAESK